MPTEFKVELLPQGAFLVTLTDGQKHKGRFSMCMLNRFGKAKSCEGYLETIVKLTARMSLEDYADLFLMAFQDYYRQAPDQCPWTQEKVMDELMEPMGGTATDDFLNLVKHAIGRLTTFKEPEEKKDKALATDQPPADDEKKSL